MRKTITVTIDQEGNTSVDLSGFAGQGCGKVLDDFAAGARRTFERNKPEYHQQPAGQQQKQGGGHA